MVKGPWLEGTQVTVLAELPSYYDKRWLVQVGRWVGCHGT